MTRFVEVAVEAGPVLPLRAGALLPGLYTYHVEGVRTPPLGSLVVVPFGARELPGIVVATGSPQPDIQTRPLTRQVGDNPVVSPRGVALGRWISRTYRAPLFECLALVLPPGFRARLGRTVEQGGFTPPRSRTAPPAIARATSVIEDPPRLTIDQIRARDAILEAALADSAKSFLLYGVTGSGKTLVYLEAAASVVDSGRQVIALVSEIALTSPLVTRFQKRFGERLAVLHSALTPAQHYREWARIAEGEAQIVIGARSAIFAPVPRLGLIVLDEEHEWTYKQDNSPRYHARDVALELGRLSGAPVVLSSATPDLSTYWLAEQGVHRLLELEARYGVGPEGRVGPLPLPEIAVVDLRAELRTGNTSIFSRALQEQLRQTVARGEQAILFINRRGTATCVICRLCGHVLQCRRCNVPLVYHRGADEVICHRCNRRRPHTQRCPGCGGSTIRYLGVGTQRVVDELQALLPNARVLRLDRDTSGSGRVEDHWRLFAERKIDILVGTQMIAKSLDFPYVTLVGAVQADVGLFLPDFRAVERTFQLLTQVAGRAGRAERPGSVIVQTYAPEHYALRHAGMHDYQGFYRAELRFRREHGYPPFGRVVRFVYSASDERRCWRESGRLRRQLQDRLAALGEPDLRLLGPAPCYVARVRGRYRWQVVALGQRPEGLLEGLVLPPGWIIDVDPATLL